MSREYAEKNWNFMLRGENMERFIFSLLLIRKSSKLLTLLNSKIYMILFFRWLTNMQMIHSYGQSKSACLEQFSVVLFNHESPTLYNVLYICVIDWQVPVKSLLQSVVYSLTSLYWSLQVPQQMYEGGLRCAAEDAAGKITASRWGTQTGFKLNNCPPVWVG